MPYTYAPIHNPTTTQDRELEASFDDDSDVEDHETDAQAEARPLNTTRSISPPSNDPPLSARYNFENLDYDYPPPGSPPSSSTFALPGNGIGNSNGRLPQAPHIPSPQQHSWFRKAIGAIFPRHHLAESSSGRVIGGGIENDGVFANLNAKPARGRVIDDGQSGIHVVPEDAQKEAPPSYASAQADAVPPYWETTIHAPTTVSSAGEMMVDGLPTGSFFSFLWNLLVSMSFQFVGFLLTFLLHSTHAAKLGSRAGLGITLIHYGFYLRTRSSSYDSSNSFLSAENNQGIWNWPTSTGPTPATPTFGTAAEAEGYYGNNPVNDSAPMQSYHPMNMKPMFSEGTTEWLSFLLMTIGWFILLTSTLSFWRVKRWELSILASAPVEASPDESSSHAHNPFHALERFGFPGAMWRRQNSLGMTHNTNHELDEEATIESNGEHQIMLPPNPDDREAVERAAWLAQARATDIRLQRDLRAAGLL